MTAKSSIKKFSLYSFLETYRIQIIFWCILLIGIFARIYEFGIIPGELNQDEAYSGYEAYSLLYYGMDSSGHTMPVYLTAWGSGMNVLNSLLMIPFIALFGLKVWVIRLPQVILAILSMPVAYLLIKKIFSQTTALFSLFFLAIAPWHIMMARWGLESNLAPAFLLFGLYFFLCGMEKAKYYYVSAIMYGLSLYCYATIWPIMPLILLGEIIYAVITKRIKVQKETILSAVILCIFACPLLLFLCVNKGLIPEINLPFLSIPKLVSMRSDEISFANIPANFKNLIHILAAQNDGLPWNSTTSYGLLYPFGMVLFLFSLCFLIIQIFRKIRLKQSTDEILLFLQLIAAVILGCLISVNINRINCIFIPIILITATGISEFCLKFHKALLCIPGLVCLLLFGSFEHYYFTSYNKVITPYFYDGAKAALAEAASHQKKGSDLQITPNLSYSIVLFYQQESVKTFHDTVTFSNYPSPYLAVSHYKGHNFAFDINSPDPNCTYILDCTYDTAPLINNGFQAKTYGHYCVLWK